MEVKLCKNVGCLTATRESWVEVDAHLHQRVGFCENICPAVFTQPTPATHTHGPENLILRKLKGTLWKSKELKRNFKKI